MAFTGIDRDASQSAFGKLGNLLIAEAKTMSPRGITLLVNTDNTRAIRFYERNAQGGYDPINLDLAAV